MKKIKAIPKQKAICCTLSCKKNISKETLAALAEMFKTIITQLESRNGRIENDKQSRDAGRD